MSEIVVVKYGGAAMSEEYTDDRFTDDIGLLLEGGARVAIVHGGGSQVTELARRLGIRTEFVDGHRVTDAAMMDAAVMGLAGLVNKSIVGLLRSRGIDAIGLCGVDGGLLRARKLEMPGIDLGLVGRVEGVNVKLLDLLMSNGMVPVIAPIGIDEAGTLYNINADLAAGGIASAIGAATLLYLSNVKGIAVDGSILPMLTDEEARSLVERGVIHGGMLPKVESAFEALEAGVATVKIGGTVIVAGGRSSRKGAKIAKKNAKKNEHTASLPLRS